MSAAQDPESPLEVCLGRLGLQDYQPILASQGFHSWLDVIDITEQDMSDMNFKRGHRRKLQRAIASFHGKSVLEPLNCLSQSDHDACNVEDPQSSQEKTSRRIESSRRRYRRRPPKDPNAPKYPRNAYVLFANFLRQNHQDSNLSFVSFAKLVGETWQCLSQEEKEVWISLAAARKSEYESEVSRYRQSEQYRAHEDRLQRYKERKLNEDTMVPYSGLYRSSRSPQGRRSSKCSSSGSSSNNSTTTAAAGVEELAISCATGTPLSVFSSSALLDSDKARLELGLHNKSYANRLALFASSERPRPHLDTCNNWAKLLQEHQSICYPGLIEIDKDFFAPRNRDSTRGFRDYYIQDTNPFHTVAKSIVWPHLDCFLQLANKSHTFICAEYLAQQLQLAEDVTNSLPNYVIYTLCLCVSIGCQLHATSNDAMVIYWYEYGLKFLDYDGWDPNLNVARALALISMFHMAKRPATAYCCLGMALKIGVAHNDIGGIKQGGNEDGTFESEWSAILDTLDDIHQFLRGSVPLLLGDGEGLENMSSAFPAVQSLEVCPAA